MSYSIRRPLTAEEKNYFPGLSELTAGLLFHRGIKNGAESEKFLSPDYELHTHDPFLMKDMGKAAERIIQAIKNNERIAVYADYDADGLPGAAMFHDFFGRIGFKNFSVYIPHRHDEGFGLNREAVEQLASEGVKLIVTIDCGIADAGPIAKANELGLEVIVTDHHEPPGVLPPAFAVVDHKRKDCAYPDKNLCGSGVGFKLIQAILKLDRFGLPEGKEKWFLDLAGMATLSDMVPLTGENRVLAHFGLRVFRKSLRKGLVQLLKKLNIAQDKVTEDDIAFMITPRINAASRMGVPMDAFKMLRAETDEEAWACAKHLDEINDERKGVVASLVKEIKKTIRERHGQEVPRVIVLGNPSWRPALLGLAANACAEEFNRPVFLWGRDGDNNIKGSCRSDGSTHVLELMRATPPDCFSQFGGHRHSGGFAVSSESVHSLEMRLIDAMQKISVDPLGSEASAKMIDAELRLEDVNKRLHEEVGRLSPFGTGNPKPVFLFRDVGVGSVRRFGKASQHVELSLKDGRRKVQAISFFGAEKEWSKNVSADSRINLVASLERSTFRGRDEIRLRIEDVKLC